MNEDFAKLFKTMMEQSQEMVRAFNPALESLTVKGLENYFPTMTKDMMEMWFSTMWIFPPRLFSSELAI